MYGSYYIIARRTKSKELKAGRKARLYYDNLLSSSCLLKGSVVLRVFLPPYLCLPVLAGRARSGVAKQNAMHIKREIVGAIIRGLKESKGIVCSQVFFVLHFFEPLPFFFF
jgi:hypothetical protein